MVWYGMVSLDSPAFPEKSTLLVTTQTLAGLDIASSHPTNSGWKSCSPSMSDLSSDTSRRGSQTIPPWKVDGAPNLAWGIYHLKNPNLSRHCMGVRSPSCTAVVIPPLISQMATPGHWPLSRPQCSVSQSVSSLFCPSVGHLIIGGWLPDHRRQER